MEILLEFADDILLIIGFVLLVVAGAHISPVLALYTAAVECLVGAYLVGYSTAGSARNEVDDNAHT